MEIDGLLDRTIHPGVAGLVRYACELAGDDLLPRRNLFRPERVNDVIGSLFLVDVLTEHNDYYFSLVGRQLVELFGADLTDKRLSQIGDAAFSMELRRTYDRVVATHLPLHMVGRYVRPHASIAIERLLIPMTDDEGYLNSICGVSALLDISEETLDRYISEGPAQLVGDEELVLAA